MRNTNPQNEQSKYIRTSDMLTIWAKILTEQHNQLNIEILSLEETLMQEHNSLLIIDAAIKKLTSGLILHLELENCFLYPNLQKSNISHEDCNLILEGYQCLKKTCLETQDYVRQLKINNGHAKINSSQIISINAFIQKIKTRLQFENIIYANASIQHENSNFS